MIVNCVAYQNGRRLTNIPVSEIHSYISHTDCFVWVALNDATPDELQVMQREFSLHDLALEDAQHGHQRPKIEEYEGFLFVVLHMIERSGDELNVGEVGSSSTPCSAMALHTAAGDRSWGTTAAPPLDSV